MCWSLCSHFVAYELIRSASVALLTAAGDNDGLGHTITAGFPLSAIALYAVHYVSMAFGVRHTLRLSHLFTICVIAVMAAFSKSLLSTSTRISANGLNWGKLSVICFYCFREIYVGIIATQNWSFVKIPYDLLVKFAGLVSVASVIGSICVEFLAKQGGVQVLLVVGIIVQCVAWVFAEASFATGQESHHNSSGEEASPTLKKTKSFYVESSDLMAKNTTLQLLLLEAILHQGCSNLLNQLFYDGLRRHISSDTGRAVLIGRFFAVINFLSCILQCVVVPLVMTPRLMPSFLTAVPIIVLVATAATFTNESLLSVMLGFGCMKVLEYSVMTSAMEMIYMPMGHEVRYLGKELIRFFGHRLGKSGTSLMLSAASAHFRPTVRTQSIWSTSVAAMWGASMFLLSQNLHADVVSLLERRIRARSLGKDPQRSKEEPWSSSRDSPTGVTASNVRGRRDRAGSLVNDAAGAAFASLKVPGEEPPPQAQKESPLNSSSADTGASVSSSSTLFRRVPSFKEFLQSATSAGGAVTGLTVPARVDEFGVALLQDTAAEDNPDPETDDSTDELSQDDGNDVFLQGHATGERSSRDFDGDEDESKSDGSDKLDVDYVMVRTGSTCAGLGGVGLKREGLLLSPK